MATSKLHPLPSLVTSFLLLEPPMTIPSDTDDGDSAVPRSTCRLGDVLRDFLSDSVDLHCQFSGWGNDNDPSTIHACESCLVQRLDCWNQKRQCLPRTCTQHSFFSAAPPSSDMTCLGSSQDVLPFQRVWNTLRLNLRHTRHAHLMNGLSTWNAAAGCDS